VGPARESPASVVRARGWATPQGEGSRAPARERRAWERPAQAASEQMTPLEQTARPASEQTAQLALVTM